MKYGTFKYGTAKYGKYELNTNQTKAIKQGVRYRIRTINSKKQESPRIQNTSITFTTPEKASKIRIKSNQSDFIVSQGESLSSDVQRVRVRASSSPLWVESVIGTVELKKVK